MKASEQLVPGMLLTFDERPHRVTVGRMPNPGEIVFRPSRHYQRPDEASVPAMQLIYDDVLGNFPWDDGYSIPSWIQPRPGDYTA